MVNRSLVISLRALQHRATTTESEQLLWSRNHVLRLESTLLLRHLEVAVEHIRVALTP